MRRQTQWSGGENCEGKGGREGWNNGDIKESQFENGCRERERMAHRGALNLLRKNFRTLKDGDLIHALQSEIAHELSSIPFENQRRGSLGDFAIEFDDPGSHDVVLKRRRAEEEVAVSALLSPFVLPVETSLEFPRWVSMKVCLRKPGFEPVLQFDCNVSGKSGFAVWGASCRPSPGRVGISDYRGPVFRSLDLQLQEALKDYLIDRGINEDLTDFLLLHLHKKEHS
ncbi:hypothetical protein QJS10_CPA05g00745 [Acorus calamus]|uniref:Uncharacterized protein n=1 Tax=Acorus calamus TaxID=4465 RepID=A0AAV9ETP9_ACOCL|nr:hypothetical protein QJS10_CPA05g00745 [Acorus calamus]